MRKSAKVLAAISAPLALWAGAAAAQVAYETVTYETVTYRVHTVEEPRQLDGKVMDVAPTSTMVSMVMFEDGTQVFVPTSTTVAGNPPAPGDEVVVQYVDNGGEKYATFVRVLDAQAP